MSCSVFQCFGAHSKSKTGDKFSYWDEEDEPSSPFGTLTRTNSNFVDHNYSNNNNNNCNGNTVNKDQRNIVDSLSDQRFKSNSTEVKERIEEGETFASEERSDHCEQNSQHMSAALTSSLNYNGQRQMFPPGQEANVISQEQRMTSSGGFTFTPSNPANQNFDNSQSFQEPVHVVAKFNYAATESTELSMKKGEKLVLMDSTGDWWRVQNGANKIGKVPSNHVEIIPSEGSPNLGLSSRGSKKSSSFFKKILGGKSKKSSSSSNITQSPRGVNQLGQNSNGALSFNYLTPIGGTNSTGFNRDENGTFNGYTMSQNPASFGAPPLAANKLESQITPGGVGGNTAGAGGGGGTGSLSPVGQSSALGSNPETAIAIYNYQAAQADELNLTKGDQVTVLQKSTDGWWQVFCNGKTGWIPSNYLNVNTTAAALGGANLPLSNQATSQMESNINTTNNNTEHNQSSQYGRDTNGSLGKQPGDSNIDSAFLFGVIALYRFQAQDLNELTFEKDERLDVIGEPTSDQDWWQARNSQGLMGLIPKKFVQQVPDSKPIFRRPNSGGSAAAVANSAMMRSNNSGIAGARSPVTTTAASSIVNSIRQESMKGAGGPYKDRDWYYGRITRNDCERLFEEVGDYGDFIVRESESCPGDYSISLKAQPKNRHFHVQLQPHDKMLLIGSKTFENLDQIIEHYHTSPIYTDGTGTRLFLQKPLIV